MSVPTLNSNPEKLLLIDDSEDICVMVSQVLELEGISVLTRMSAKEGIRTLEERKDIGLVLLDFSLPDMTGKEFLEEIKNRGLDGGLPVVAFTASSDSSLNSTPGLTGVIKKPIGIDQLIGRVKSYLDH